MFCGAALKKSGLTRRDSFLLCFTVERCFGFHVCLLFRQRLFVLFRLVQGWAIAFLSGPVTENELAYRAGDSKLNTELHGNQKRIYLPITSITASAQNNTASIPSDTTISGTDVAYCMCPKVCPNQA